MEQSSGKLISTILRHDRKITSYKLALIRAINDIVLSFPDLGAAKEDIAIPLPLIASYWVAYYWPFASGDDPIYQGQRATKQGIVRNDLDFRPELTALRQEWELFTGTASRAADGFYLVSEMRVPRKRGLYPAAFVSAYDKLVKKVAATVQNPIRYAGPSGEEWSIFERPEVLSKLTRPVTAVPGTTSRDTCLILPSTLYRGFYELSLWIEALSIHEWALFSEKIIQAKARSRGEIYTLLTDRPDNRRPLSWERNQVEILLLEGKEFVCPWTERKIVRGTSYDLDHIIPIAIYPTNELWNLVPSDPRFNKHTKRERMPSSSRLEKAFPHLVQTYAHYHASSVLSTVIGEDASVRFSGIKAGSAGFAETLARAAVSFTRQVAQARNLAEF